MMHTSNISVVIISLNAANTIAQCIEAAQKISNDIVLVDSGSTDGTMEIAAKLQATVISIEWKGYSHSKIVGNKLAKNDWILSLDSDEVLSTQLINSINSLNFSQFNSTVFKIKLLNFIGNKPVKYGEFMSDSVVRIFNKKITTWSNDAVHEFLIHQNSVNEILLKGCLKHFTSYSINHFSEKQKKYALLMANKYYKANKQASFIKIYFSPVFSFIKNYIFKLGFLDGKIGFEIALVYANYTYNKYQLLNKLNAEHRS